jgi:hypothetical protein
MEMYFMEEDGLMSQVVSSIGLVAGQSFEEHAGRIVKGAVDLFNRFSPIENR